MAKHRERNVYDINKLTSFIDKNSIEMEPIDHNSEKMAIFAANVNLRRHIPEIRDGLLPVQRRLLMIMYEQKLYNKKFSKSSQIIGDVVKKYHPHSPEAAYGCLVRMGQSWMNNIQLVSTNANYGSSYDANGYANHRYTDGGLSEFAYDCYFKDWKFSNPKDDMTIDWVDNYDGSYLEPMYLPSRYPLFLINWHKALCPQHIFVGKVFVIAGNYLEL